MEKRQKVAVAVIGSSIAIGSVISIVYWVKRKREELEELERLEKAQAQAQRQAQYEWYERDRGYAFKKVEKVQPLIPKHIIPPRGGFKEVNRYINDMKEWNEGRRKEIPPRGGFALLRLRRKTPRFNVLRTPF